MSDLKNQLIRLGSSSPELREDIRPLIASLEKEAAFGGISIELIPVNGLKYVSVVFKYDLNMKGHISVSVVKSLLGQADDTLIPAAKKLQAQLDRNPDGGRTHKTRSMEPPMVEFVKDGMTLSVAMLRVMENDISLREMRSIVEFFVSYPVY